MYSEESSALQIGSCLAALRILLNLLNLHLTLLSCLSVVRVYSTSLLFLPSPFTPLPLGVAFAGVAALVVFLVLWAGCGTFHFGNFFRASAGSSSCLTRPAWSAGLSLPCYQSLEWCHWTSEVGGRWHININSL